MKPPPHPFPTQWNVYVAMAGPATGYIGTVMETSEDNARCAALCKYGHEGNRPQLCTHEETRYIYEDDDFYVRET